MTDKLRPTRRAVVQTAAAVAALVALDAYRAEPAEATPAPVPAPAPQNAPSPRRRVPVGLL